MSTRLKTFLSALLCAFPFSACVAATQSWVVYYGHAHPFDDFAHYDIIAFDSDEYPALPKERKEGQTILGYLSTSEAETYRPYFDEIEALDVFIAKSDLWRDHIIIDIREERWRDYFVNTLVPKVLAKGFDGIMLDTIDSVIYLEEQHPKKYAGMKEAAVLLIKQLRKTHPDAKLMLNRGIPILHTLANDIDYVLAESTRVEYNFDTHEVNYFDDAIYAEYVETLKAAQAINPSLIVVTLDYWKMKKAESDTIAAIYKEQRSHGFSPYVTTIDLKKHHKEP